MKKMYYIFNAFFLLFVTSIHGQVNLKIGHIDSQAIMQQLPVTDSIQKVLAKDAGDMEQLYNEMINDHESNMKKYEAEKDTYSDFVRNAKEKDLMDTQTKIQRYYQDANQLLQQKQAELLKPVYEKINAALEKVSLANSFTYVLDLSVGAVAYYAPTSENLTPLVLKELGVDIH